MADLTFKKSLLYFSILLIVLELIVYKDFIFGKLLFIAKDSCDDTYLQAYPYASVRMESWLNSGSAPQWMFYNGLGENLYPFSFEPVSFLVWSTFFKHDIAGGFIWIQLIHTFFAGLLIFVFLRNSKLHYLPCLLGGLMYAFSGYLVAYGSWYLYEFSATAVYYAFLLLSLQQFFRYNRWYYYPLVVALLAIIQPVNLYFIAIITILYLMAYYCRKPSISYKNLLKQTVNLIAMGLLGIGLSSFMLWSNIYHMLASGRSDIDFKSGSTLSEMSFIQFGSASQLITSFFRLFSLNLSGTANHYSGWYNYFEAPVWYCGLLVLLLIPQLFHFIKGKERWFHFLLSMALVLMALFPYLRIAIWLDLGNYYRLISLLSSTLLIGYAMWALHFLVMNETIRKRTLLITVLSLLLPLLLLKSNISEYAAPSLFVIVTFLLCYGLALYGIDNLRNQKYFPQLTIAIIIIEILLFMNPVLQERNMASHKDIYGKIGYNDPSKTIVQAINKRDKSFYRIEKDFTSSVSKHYGFNDAKMQNYFGSKCHTSYTSADYLRFLQLIGAIKNLKGVKTAWINGLEETAIPMKLCNIKYYLSNSDDTTQFKQKGLTFMYEQNGIKVCKVNHSLPLGITYDHYLTEDKYVQLDSITKQNGLLQAVVIKEDDVDKLKDLNDSQGNNISSFYSEDSIKVWNNDLIKDTLGITTFDQNHIEGKVSLTKAKVMFFAIPYHKGWQIKIDNKSQEIIKVFGGLMGVYLTPGNHTIRLDFEDPYKKIGSMVSVVSLLLLLAFIFGQRIYKKSKGVSHHEQ